MEIFGKNDNLVVCITGDIDDFIVESIERLDPYLSMLEKYGISATFFVTAKAAEEYPERVEYLLKKNHIVEGHGDIHKGFYGSESNQIERLNAMKTTFSRLFSIDIKGFRAPWYQHNSTTYLALDRSGLKYDCSKKRFEIAFKAVPFFQKRYMYTKAYPCAKPLLALVGSIYNAYYNSQRLPFYITPNVLELPTLGISDYSLIGDPQGPRYLPNDSDRIGEIWAECLTVLKQRGGGVLTLQAHPGRLSPDYISSLDYFIKSSKQLGADFSTPKTLTEQLRGDYY